MHLSEMNMKATLAKATGEPASTIANRYGVTTQRVLQILKGAREHLVWLELELVKARRTDDAVALLVPYQDQEDRKLALDYLDLCVRELRRRGVEVETEHRPTTEGSVFFLFDRTEYNNGGSTT